MTTWIYRHLRENRGLLVFLALMLVFRSAIADWNEVPTGSMKPTILEGDRIWGNKMAYDIRVPFTHIALVKLADPERGDIVVFDSSAADKRLVKRVVGLPGDTVGMRDNTLSINGEPLAYETVSETDKLEHLPGTDHLVRTRKNGSRLASFHPVKVPQDHYLVLGDNRDNSSDSRVIGFVPRNEIVGRSRHVVLSFNYDNFYIPRAGRFFYTL